MKSFRNRIAVFTFFLSAFTLHFSFAQKGNVVINQDIDLIKLLAIKKDMNLNDSDSERYKIQIYSGNRLAEAQKAQTKFRNMMTNLPTKIAFETPNYKVRVGNFRTRLEADRGLVKVQKEFKSAFVFKPKKEKNK